MRAAGEDLPKSTTTASAPGGGAVESLWGRVRLADMGTRVSREKPTLGALPAVAEKASRATKGRRTKLTGIDGRGDLPGASYRPRTRETAAAWEYVLAFIAARLGEVPREVLAAAAEECAGIILDSGSGGLRDLEKKERIERIMGRIDLSNEQYNQLVNLCKRVTDFVLAPTAGTDTTTNEWGQGQEEGETEMAVVFEEEEDDQEEMVPLGAGETEGDEGTDEEADAAIPIPIIMASTMAAQAELGNEDAGEGEVIELVTLSKRQHMASGTCSTADTDAAAAASEVSSPPELDLESLAFTQGSHTMTNRKCIVPEQSVKTSRPGYEEIRIPAPAARPPTEDELVPVDDLPMWARAAFASTRALNRVQSRLYPMAFGGDENFLLCAPTGAGKTNVALLAMLREIGKHLSEGALNRGENLDQPDCLDRDAFKIVYMAPMKALVQEMVENFSRKLAPYGLTVAELTGDAQLNRAQIEATQVLITTPEKWDVITRKGSDVSYTRLVRLLIIDEVHLLHDERGPVLEAIVARTLRAGSGLGASGPAGPFATRLVGLSATLPNYRDVGRFLRVDPRQGIFYFDNSYRPCPLVQQFVGLTERRPLQRMQLMNEIVYEKVAERAGQHQVLVFVHSRKDTGKTAQSIKGEAMSRGTIGAFLRASADSQTILAEAARSARDAQLQDLLPYGFAIHHAGMTRSDRNMVESLFAEGHVQLLVSTATLAWGVNLPAHTVIIKGTQVYRPERGGWTELSAQDVLQMLGRAGRPQYDTQGEGIILTAHSELQYYLSLMNQQLPIESQLIGTALVDHLNAEIVLGTISTVDEAIDWLGDTYLYVRMLRDQTGVYGVTGEMRTADPELRSYRRALVHAAATVLDKANLIRYDRRTGLLRGTEVARIASHYYITHHSMATYNAQLKPTISDIDLVRIFSCSHEFRLIPVRLEERVELTALAQRVPIPIREGTDEPVAKINMLLQAYISQLALEGFALAADMIYVTQSAGRILRALFELCLRRGWARAARVALDLCRQVERRQWRAMSPLRQLADTVPADIIRKVERKDFAWDLIFELSPAELGELIRTPSAGRTLHSALATFPRVALETATVPLRRDLIRLELTLRPRITRASGELFWLLVEDCDGDVLLHGESLVLRGQEERQLSLLIPLSEPIPPILFVRVLADRWLGCETHLAVNLTRLVLPEKRGSSLDLSSVETATMAMSEGEIENEFASYPAMDGYLREQLLPLLGLERGNLVRAAYSAAFKSDQSLLIGACPNLQAELLGELAIWRTLIQHEGGERLPLMVYIGPADRRVLTTQRERWSRIYKDLPVAVLTGDGATDMKLVERGGLLLASARDWDQLSRRWKSRRSLHRLSLLLVGWLPALGVDACLEVGLSRVRLMASHLGRAIRIVALGLPQWNARETAAWLGIADDCIFNVEGWGRLAIKLAGSHIGHAPSMVASLVRPLVREAAGRSNVLIYVPDGETVRQVASLLLENAQSSLIEGGTGGGAETVAAAAAPPTDELLGEALGHGIAFYDGSTVELEHVMAWGARVTVLPANQCHLVNLLLMDRTSRPELVVIMSTSQAEYDLSDLWAMIGSTDQGALIYCPAARRTGLAKLLEEAPPSLESALDAHLVEALNAEIAIKTISTAQEAVDWLTWSLLYRRLARNPNYYGLAKVDALALSEFLSELVEGALAGLGAAGCIQEETVDGQQVVQPMNLGLIAAYYGVHCATIEALARSLTGGDQGTCDPRTMLEYISQAAVEFANDGACGGVLGSGVYEQEVLLLERLHRRLPYRWPSGRPDYRDGHVRAFLLLVAHCARIKLPRPGLDDGRRAIVEMALRLVQATVDVTAAYGLLSACLTAMETGQLLVQALLPTDPPIKQVLPGGSALKAALEREITSVYDLDETLLEHVEGASVRAGAIRAANRFPSLEVLQLGFEESQVPIEGGDTRERTLTVRVERTAAPGPVIAPWYPALKEEAWWLVVGVKGTLLAIKRFTVHEEATVSVPVALAEAEVEAIEGGASVKAYLICDSYVGADQELDVSNGSGRADQSR